MCACVMGPCEVHIEHGAEDGTTTVLKEKPPLASCEVLDESFMDCSLLCLGLLREVTCI